jgi:hypothetical protein
MNGARPVRSLRTGVSELRDGNIAYYRALI